MKDKRGFTLIELLGVLVILGVIATIAVASYSSYITKAREESYRTAENSMKSAVTNFYTECENGSDLAICNDLPAPQNKGETTKVYLKDLINYDFLKKISDPGKKEAFCNEQASYVLVTNTTETFNLSYDYQVCLVCSKYKSATCR